MRPELLALLTLADEKLRAAGLLVTGGVWGMPRRERITPPSTPSVRHSSHKGKPIRAMARYLGPSNRAFQDISLPERLRGTGNRRTKSAEEPGLERSHLASDRHSGRSCRCRG